MDFRKILNLSLVAYDAPEFGSKRQGDCYDFKVSFVVKSSPV